MASAIDAIYKAVVDLITLSQKGAPTAIVDGILNRRHERKIQEAKRVLLSELSRGKKTELQLRECDDHIDIMVSFYYAALRGRARENLRLLARLIVNLNDCDELYARKFDRHQNSLSELDIDEIRVLAFAARELRGKRKETPGFKSIHIHDGRLREDAFKGREDYAGAALTKVTRSGYISTWVTGGSVGGGGTLVFQTTPLLLEILDVIDESFLAPEAEN